MSTKMKGLLKGLRYISQIFDEEEEPELQIGLPTDVKHVAHIGWDGPTANAPSWISQFKNEGELPGGLPPTAPGQNCSRAREAKPSVQERRASTGSDSTVDSPSKRRSDKTKASRRQSSASAGSSAADSPRRSTASDNGSASSGTTKISKRKKPKASSSKTSSKSKPPTQTADSVAYPDAGTGR